MRKEAFVVALVNLLGGVQHDTSVDFRAGGLAGDGKGRTDVCPLLRWLFLTGSINSFAFDGSFLCDLLTDVLSPGQDFSLSRYLYVSQTCLWKILAMCFLVYGQQSAEVHIS